MNNNPDDFSEDGGKEFSASWFCHRHLRIHNCSRSYIHIIYFEPFPCKLKEVRGVMFLSKVTRDYRNKCRWYWEYQVEKFRYVQGYSLQPHRGEKIGQLFHRK